MKIKIAGKKNLVLAGLLAALAAMTVASQAASSSTATGKRPNIVIILGDDLGSSDNAPTDLRMDGFRISLTYGWHKIVEG